MINNSLPTYLFIRTSIFALRAITPLSILYIIARPFIFPIGGYLRLLPLDIYAAAETAFFIFAYLPLKALSQRPAVHPPLVPKDERRTLFTRCISTTRDFGPYLRRWFRDAETEEIRGENVKEFFAWAFLNEGTARDVGVIKGQEIIDEEDEAELDRYVNELESAMGMKLEKGYGSAKPLRLTMDEVRMAHRPFVWYMIILLVDLQTHVWLLWHGFSFYRTPLNPKRPWPAVFPPRPQTLLTTHVSATRHFSYWHRPHTSKTHRPILFLHGIGVGLNTYVPFLASLNTSHDPEEGDIGILALELLPISFRITSPLPRREDFLASLSAILDQHPEFANGFTLLAHSYGSVLATHILASPSLRPLVKSLILIDPVSLLLHLPDVAYNFTYRRPRTAAEWQLWYFACSDMCVAHTLARGFFWSENILWKENVEELPVTAFLAGRDQIIPVGEVSRYLTDDTTGGSAEEGEGEGDDSDGWAQGTWDEDHTVWRASENGGKEKTVVWCEGLDHAQVFDVKEWRTRLVKEVKRASALKSGLDQNGI